jgi:hypothetical protein
MKAAPRDDRDDFIAAHKESCGEPRFRTFDAVDESRDGKAAVAKAEEPKESEAEENPAEKFSSKKKFSKKKKSS